MIALLMTNISSIKTMLEDVNRVTTKVESEGVKINGVASSDRRTDW
jgi:hypothetical protein